jgi:hypothetical protein
MTPTTNARTRSTLARSLAVAALVGGAMLLSASCGSNAVSGAPNGSTCNGNGDCASNCCVAGGYPPGMSGTAKLCAEPSGCFYVDSSAPPPAEAGADTSSATTMDTGTSADTGSPATDSGKSD